MSKFDDILKALEQNDPLEEEQSDQGWSYRRGRENAREFTTEIPEIDTRGVPPDEGPWEDSWGKRLARAFTGLEDVASAGAKSVGALIQGRAAKEEELLNDVIRGIYEKSGREVPDLPSSNEVPRTVGKGFSLIGDYLQERAHSPEREKAFNPNNRWKGADLVDIITQGKLGDYLTDTDAGFLYETPYNIGNIAGFLLPTKGIRGTAATDAAGKLLNPVRSLLGKLGFETAGDVIGSKAAKEMLGTSIQFGATMGPYGAMVNAGTMVDELKKQGKSDAEIADAISGLFAEELPADIAFAALTGNVIKGKLGNAIAPRGSSLTRKILANAAGIPLEMAVGDLANVNQMILSEKYSGQPYGELFGERTEAEKEAGRMGAMAGLPFAIYGGGRGVVDARAADAAYERFQKELAEGAPLREAALRDLPEISRQAYADAQGEYNDANLRAWAQSQGVSDEVYNLAAKVAQEEGVPVERVIATIVKESNGDQNAVSEAGAIGVMQLMPGTAQSLGVDPYDLEQNIRGGVRYLKQQYNTFGDWDLAHAAYNAGEGALYDENGNFRGIPPYRETQNYVAQINDYLDEVGSGKATGGDGRIGKPGYRGEGGKGEGTYWVRNNGVSFDGAQPGLMDAMDMLGKYVYDNTGVQLVASAGTNGDHPSNGTPHGHDAGWKVDIVDAGANGVPLDADGVLFTKDFMPTEFCQKLIAYGRKLGLGMNLEGVGTSNVHIDVALDGTQWQGSLGDAGGFNPRNADDRPTIQQRADELVDQRFRERVSPQRQEQPQPPEPMQARQIDFKATDDETKSVFDGFAKEQANKAIADGDGETALFFRDMFNGDEFQNTPENRAAIAERYGTELTQFAQTFTPTLSQTTEQTQPVSVSAPRPQAQPAAGGTANKYVRNNDVIQAGNNFLEELRAKGTQADMETTVRLQAAITSGDAATVENILKANNRPVVAAQQQTQPQPQQQQQTQPQPQQQQQTQPQNDPVKQNGTPENVLTQQQQPQQQEATQPQQPAKPKKQPKTAEEKAQSYLANPLQGTKKVKTRRRAGKAVLFLADNNGIVIPDADRESLEHGKTKVINQWRETLISQGILSPQTTQSTPKKSSSAQPSQPQQPAKPAEKPLTLQERMQQIVNTAAQQSWQETQDKYKRRAEYTKLQRRQDEDEAENARVTEANVARFNNTERNEEYQELQRRQDEDEAENARVSEESNKRFAQEQQEHDRQAKQEKELQELQTRQEAEKRAAEDSARRTAEQEKEIAQRQSLPSDIAAALAPPSLSANTRKKQGNAIADLINSTPFKDMFGVISLPAGLEPALRNGHEKAINTARDILSRRGVHPVEWTQQEAEIISEDTETPAPYEPPQQTVGRHEETVITHETPDRPPQIELDSALTTEPVAHDKAKRKRQGEAIHRVINSPQFIAAYGRVKLPAALESTLQRGEYKAIETVQRMLRERGIIPQPEAQPIQETQPEQETKPKEETSDVPLKETTPETESTSVEEEARDAESERLEARMDDAEALEGLFEEENERTEPQEERPTETKDESPKEKQADVPLKETKTGEKPKPETNSMEGEADTRIINVIEDESTLTPFQKLLKSFSEKLGVPLKFFRNPDGKFHGSFSNGVLFLNANSKKGLGGVFWHEAFHWLKANNPQLYAKLVDAAGITDKDRQAFLDRTGRKDVKTNEEIDEEILADQMDDVAKRTGLLQAIAGKNRGVIERVVQWLKDTMNKFIETFRNPTGRLTTKQAQALAKEFGQIARQLKDENGEQIFRVNNRTGDIEVVEGRKARELSNEEIETAAKSLDRKLSFAGINALTADLNAFDKAEEMANKGASREEIFKETKLVRGKDGLYRFEIPDNLDKIDFAPLVKNGRATLGEIYKNSKLYAAYPKLRDIEVVATSERLGKNGAYWLGFEYDPVKGHTLTERININLSPKGLPVAARKAWAKQQRGTLIHEIQHAIQAREQFATGGDALNVRAKLADARGDVTIAEGESDHDLYWRLGGEQEAREAQDRAELKARKKEEKRLRSELTDIIPTLPPDTQKKFKDFIAATKAKSDDMFDIADSLPDDTNKDILTDWANAVDDIEELSKNNGRIPQIHGDNAIIIRGEYGADVYSAQSVSNPNDNSSESLRQKIKNFASTVFSGKPQSKNHKQFIVDKLDELTRYKTYFNTNAKNEADVVIDSFQKIIRARHAYDFEKLLPAAGEPIAKVLGLTPSDKLSDCIANWMMTGVLTSSQEATAFQNAMKAHPAEAELLQSIRDTFQEMANMSAEEAVESNIVRDKKSKTFREWLGEKFSKEQWVDDLHPIKQAYDQMLAKAPPAVADIIKKNIDPYTSASLFRGKGTIADMMIGDKKEVTAEDIDIVRRVLQHVFPNVNFSNFKPLAAIAKMVDYDVEGLERYALAKLDKEMHEKKNSGDPKYADLTPSYTEAQCDEIIKAGKAKYDAAQRELVNYANTLAAIQYSTGVISANQFYQRVNGWKNYVPTARVFEEYEDISVDKSDSSKHKTGSKRRVYAPLGKLEDNTNLFIRQALQNSARLEIVTIARLGNFGDIVAETPKGYPHGHTIHFKENGKMKYLVTPDESLARAVEAIQTPADANIVVQAFKTAGMVMRGLYTMWNFEFASGNPFRDLADAFIHNKYGSRNPFVAIPAMVSAAVSGLAQSVGARIKSEEFRTFLAEGGAQSGFSYEITEGASRRVNSFGKKSLAKNVWDKFLMIAEASENITRFSTFKTAKDNLAKQHGGVPTPHDLKLAAMQARRATVDFARSGRTMRGVNKVALFSNAAMQSLALWGEKINAYRKGKEGAGKELFAAVFKTVMGGVMPALAFAALNFSDDERRKRFEERPTWEKDTYWIFGDGLRVPKGMDLGIKLTSALTEEFAMWLASNKPVEWKRIVNNIGRGLPSITTTIFTPAVESYMNYSIFKDAPIVPYGQQNDPKYKQYGKNTSWFAKWLGKTFNESPRQIDHLIAGYGGSMATALTGGTDGIPIVRRFLFDPDKNPRIVQDYYKALEEQEEMFAEYKARRADGEKVELPEDYDRGLHARLKKSREAMTRISKAEMRIMDDPKLDADKREEKLRELEKRRVALCERVLGKAR